MNLKEVVLPPEVNYIAAFLTLRCNLNCSYCINRYGDFTISQEMNAEDWIKGLARIQTRLDLPITLCGGEPTIFPTFYIIANELDRQGKFLDLLTNGSFDMRHFMNEIQSDVFKRYAPYASIRFSYHKNMNPIALAMKVWKMQNDGYEVGIWGLDINDNTEIMSLCKGLNIDFRTKEYLDEIHGTYKYPDAITRKGRKNVWCKTSELLINPSGCIFKCHADLYGNRDWIGHILREDIPDFKFRQCPNYGYCNPCDIKLKTNRLQEFGYCAVEIKDA